MSSLVLEAAGPRGAVTLDARLAVAPGECLALTGPSGSGKTSLLRIVAGLLRPERGRVALGDDVWLDTERGVSLPPERRGCGMVFQDYALWDHLPAWRNVAYGMRSTPRGARRARAEELLGGLGLAERAGARAAELSGGERQRVALARALARDPAVLLLDEPLGALDARSRGEAARVLGATLRESGVPAVIVTHSFPEAAFLADRVAVLERGHVAQAGPPGELAAAPVSAWVAELTGASVLLGDAVRDADGGTLVRLEGGGEVVATDGAEPGAVAVSVHPWEVVLEPAGSAPHGSARNRLPVDVVSVTELGPRVRVGLAAPQLLAAEVTAAAARELALRPGLCVVATWKAAATRVLPR